MAGWTRLPKEQQEALYKAQAARDRAVNHYWRNEAFKQPPSYTVGRVTSATSTNSGVAGGTATGGAGDLWTLVALAAGALAVWRTFEYLAVTGLGSVWLMLAGAAAVGFAAFRVVDSTLVRTVSFALLKIGFVLAVVGVISWAARNYASH